MKFSCIICDENFESQDDVSATSCGHIFHGTCLTNWLQRDQSCPHCRKYTNWNNNVIKKLYFECSLDVSEEKYIVLKNELRAQKAELAAVKIQFAEARLQLSEAKVDNLKSAEDLRNLNNKQKLRYDMLNEEILGLKNRVKEVVDLKNKLKEYGTIKQLVSHSSVEIEQVRFDGHDKKQLIEICGVSKKLVSQFSTEVNQLKIRLKNLNSEYLRLKRERLTDKYRNDVQTNSMSNGSKLNGRESNVGKENFQTANLLLADPGPGPNAFVACGAEGLRSDIIQKIKRSISSAGSSNYGTDGLLKQDARRKGRKVQ